jgi:hypothetical protein
VTISACKSSNSFKKQIRQVRVKCLECTHDGIGVEGCDAPVGIDEVYDFVKVLVPAAALEGGVGMPCGVAVVEAEGARAHHSLALL